MAKRRAPWIWPAIAGALVIAAAAVSFVHFRESPPPADPLKFSLTLPADRVAGFLALSPDGRRLVLATTIERKNGLYLRALDSSDFHLLEGTEGARSPFWSPDNRFIGFFADAKLKTVPAAGGPATTLCGETGIGRGGTWNRAGVILFASQDSKLRRVSAAGGQCTPISVGDENIYGSVPEFLPDANHFLFTGGNASNLFSEGIYLAALDGTKPRKILNDSSSALYSPPASRNGAAHLLFRRGSNLMAQPFDSDKLEPVGDPFVITSPVSQAATPPQVAASVAPNGTLVYESYNRPTQLTWFDRSGKELGKAGAPGERGGVALSPDGSRATVYESTTADPIGGIRLFDLTRNSDTRVTPIGRPGEAAVWSPDGARIIYTSNDGPNNNLFLRNVDGGGPETPLLPPSVNRLAASDWSRDGRLLIYTEIDNKTLGDIWYLPDPGKQEIKPVKFVGSDANESQGQLSPDGRWLAYFSDEGGSNGVYVRSFPSGDRVVKVADKAYEPRWNKNGIELFYLTSTGRQNAFALMAAAFQASANGSVRLGAAQKLMEFRGRGIVPQDNWFQYSPDPDGKRFLVLVIPGESKPEIDVITNWQQFVSGGK